MEKDKMLYTGLCCKVNAKAALIDMCMRLPSLEAKLLMSSAVQSAGYKDQICGTARETGAFAVQVKLDEEKRERIYDELFGKMLGEGRLEQIPAFDWSLLEPVEKIHQKEVNIDVIPFLVCGIVRNSRCRERLMVSVSGFAGECLARFWQSEYNTTGYLKQFLLDERRAARLAAGLLLLLREGEEDGIYRTVMDIIYAGYRPYKNRIKKLDCLKGKYYKESLAKDVIMELQLARMVIQMVIAEDLGVPVVHDFEFCRVACLLQSYEDDRKNGEVREMDMTEGKRIYRKLLRRHWNPGAYYISAFLEEEECDDHSNDSDGDNNSNSNGFGFRDKMEKLFLQFGIEIRALSGLRLEKWEAEAMCAIFEEEDWERYRYLLLTATLCKYIQQIEAMYEQGIPEEVQYRENCKEDTVKHLEYEIKRLEEKIRVLEQQKKAREDELAETELLIGRLKRDSEKKERQYARERAELLEYRNAAVQSGAGENGKGKQREEARKRRQSEETGGQNRQKSLDGAVEVWEREGSLDIGRLDRSIVIGGHRNWQKKMRQCLPDSQFVASDHMNFDPAVLRNKKYIIVNTDILKHGIYYKIMSERKKEQKVVYVHGNNVDRALQEIAEQL